MDTPHWPQEIGLVKPMEEMVGNTCSRPMVERKRPQKEQALNCPRCNSTNTKFCYYNNYSLTQPRYFCKTCRRYWTEGGSLRNVPVGGGSRKNKRSSSSSTSTTGLSCITSSGSAKKPIDPPQNPKIHEGGHDLNLGFPYRGLSEFVEVPSMENNSLHNPNNPNTNNPSSTSSSLSALELLRTGISSRGLNSFMPMPTLDSSPTYSSGFALQDFKANGTLNFGVDGLGGSSEFGGLQGVQESNGRLLFPFEDLRQVSTTSEFEQSRGHGDSSGYWSGMLGGGSW